MSENAVNSTPSVHFLIELRRRLIYSFIVLFIFFSILCYFSSPLYTLLASPLLKFLPQGHLIATQIISPFFVPFKLALMVAIWMAIPFFLYQLWAFIAPALYLNERRKIWPFLCISTLLFYMGMAFAYLVILPMLFHFLSKIAPVGVILTPDITAYLDFTMMLLFSFGGLFEIPMVMVLLVSMNIVGVEKLLRCRSYAILAAFVLGMLLAPPDVLSQIVLAIPIWLLYELGILLSRFVKRSSKKY